jgi:tryptophan halogenase
MKIVVVGGGTSGYIAALTMQKKFPNYDITVIESSSIGIVGVGEATTGNFIPMLKEFSIDIGSFMKETNATIKMGSLFHNWNSDNIDFFVPILLQEKIYDQKYLSLISTGIKNDNRLMYLDEIATYALQNKIPKSFNKDGGTSAAIHFDTFLCAKFLKNVALKNNIKIIDDVVVGFETLKNEITAIKTTNNTISADFVFDCSGFSRIIIGKFYKEKWISLQDTLPINSSVVGQVPISLNIPSYIKVSALDYGWTFEIPTRSRYGIGHNFDNNFITEEDAILEVKKKINKDWEPLRSLKYNAGFYENQFVENCLAIGLSGSFFEPLEASALMNAISILNEFSKSFNEYFDNRQKFRNKINKYIKNLEEDIVSAIYIHYVTNKQNNSFWKDFVKNNKMPTQIANFLDAMNETVPNPLKSEFANKHGSYLNDYFIRIYYGNGMRNFNVINSYDEKLYNQYINIIKQRHTRWMDHKEMLELL